MDKFKQLGLLFVLIVSIFVELSYSTGGFPRGFLNDITESPVVQERLQSRWKWEVWDVVPGTHVYKIYVFNITNPDQIMSGAIPILNEIGPYAYVEHRTKFNVSINLDLTVNYQRNFTYTFDPTQSKGTENDLVTVLNVPFIIFSNWASTQGAVGNDAVNSVNNKIKGVALIQKNVRVGDFLFNGMDVSVYKPFLPRLNIPPSRTLNEFQTGKYGVLKLKRGSNEGSFTVNSGLKDQSKLGKIQLFNQNVNLDCWNGKECNVINGTDGTVLPPYVSNTERIQTFDVDLCASISFDYNTSSTFQSIVPTYEFNLNSDIFQDYKKVPSNLCFCKDENTCLRGGLLDVSKCKDREDGVPLVMSLAHFYNADPSYINAVEGVNPLESHQTQMSVQPRLGVVINYSRKFQWNIDIQKYPGLDYFRNAKFSSVILPMLWNDDHFTLDEDKAVLLVSAVANELGGYGNKSNKININNFIFISTFLISLLFY